jgi:hypothetical protein
MLSSVHTDNRVSQGDLLTHLRKRVLEEIGRRNYTQVTAHAYVSRFGFRRILPPLTENLGLEDTANTSGFIQLYRK